MAARQPHNKAWRVAVPMVCLLAGLLLATTREAAHGGELRSSGDTRLSDLVRSARADASTAEATRTRLRDEVESAQQRAGDSDGAVADALAAMKALQPDAGLTALRGPGLTVTLTDAPRTATGQYASDAAPDDLVVHQQDLQSVLNAMWAGGAEAVMVQDQRIVATSAPRCIGNTLLLHGRTYSPPYAVSAIGNADSLQNALSSERGVAIYRQYVTRFGLGYRVQTSNVVTVPAYSGSLTLKNATEIPR